MRYIFLSLLLLSFPFQAFAGGIVVFDEQQQCTTWEAAASDGWSDVNLTTEMDETGYEIPADATGVILHFLISGASNELIGITNTSTGGSYTGYLRTLSHTYMVVKVRLDGSDVKCRVYAGDVSDTDLWIVGYTDSYCTFLATEENCPPTVADAWRGYNADEGCSSVSSDATIVFLNVKNTESVTEQMAVRVGTGTDRYCDSEIPTSMMFGWITGASSGDFKMYADDVAPTPYFIVYGYCTSPMTVPTGDTELDLTGLADATWDRAGIEGTFDAAAVTTSSATDGVVLIDNNVASARNAAIRSAGSTRDLGAKGFAKEADVVGYVHFDANQEFDGFVNYGAGGVTEFKVSVLGYTSPNVQNAWDTLSLYEDITVEKLARSLLINPGSKVFNGEVVR